MNRTLIVAGVHLDRAWTDLGGGAGTTLRDSSRQVLALIAEKAQVSGVETLVILGGLTDRSSALPDTVTYAAQVLGAYPGTVVVVPGPSDWTDGNDLYALVEWAANTTVLTGATFAPIGDGSGAWGSAWTSPSGVAPRVVSEPSGDRRTFLRPALTDSERSALGQLGLVITTGPADADLDGVCTVPDLVRAPGEVGGWGVLVDLDDDESPVQRVELPTKPGSSIDLDVSRLEEPAEFAEALAASAQGAAPVVVRLVGSLAPSILLPGYGGPEVVREITLDLSELKYRAEVPDATDRSTRAEFLRAMALTRGDERERHQTTALGLRALASSMAGA